MGFDEFILICKMTTLPPLTPTALQRTTRRDSIKTPHPVSLISKCNSLRELKQIHAFYVKSDLQNDINIITKIINFCTKEPTNSTMEHAHHLFDKIPEPDIGLFNSMARGYARGNSPLLAIHLFSKIMCSGVVPDHYTFPCLIKACANLKALEEGRQLQCHAVKLGLGNDIYVSPSLINLYTECEDTILAKRVFDSVNDPCVVCYNSIISGFARNNLPNEALSFFKEMQAAKIRPTYVTMLSILSSCSLLGSLELGRWIHEFIRMNGFDQYLKVNTGLIDMYAKCGSLEEGESIFQGMSVRDTQAWSTMIMAYAIHGKSHKAINTFNEMTRKGFKPDEITFLGLLYACSHTGKVGQGYEYFNTMEDKYGVQPGIKHYGCMVDMLSRTGRLEEAYSFIEELPIKPTPILWRTLLYASCGHGNIDLAKKVIDRIFALDDTHGGDYVMMSHMCARAGKWEDVNYYRKLMNERGAVKVPGCSSTEVKGIVHEFFSGGDGRRAEYRELNRSVDELMKELKRAGYIPDLSLVHHPDMEDEEKEASLRYHSEKLAITFGLMNTPPGTTIRVVKNLTVCDDCHSAAKLMSLVSDRRIVLRDVHRFHHFEKGQCSCGDCW